MSNKMFMRSNVYESALKRINWLFDEFPHVYVGFSGGKDSTRTFQILGYGSVCWL